MGEYRRSEAGQGGSAERFYKTTLEPADWWKWFQSDYKEDDGWTEVLSYTKIRFVRPSVRPLRKVSGNDLTPRHKSL